METLTHIDLFAGIGGFALGFERAGIKTLAHVEIDEACQSVLRSHWSDHVILSDVTDAGSHNLPYADIISYGSPCQDMSIAGKREGLTGKRSVLFYEAARIIREINPRYSIWENVPGALSSNKGLDFRAVLKELLQTDVPMPRSGRWASSGMVRAGQKELAWRVLDSQYFGVPQRRRRIFLVLCTRGDSAAEILFEREGSSGNTPQSKTAGEDIAASIVSRIGKGGFTDPTNDNIIPFVQNQRNEVRDLGDKAGAIAANEGMKQRNYIAFSPFSHYDYEQSEQAATIHNARQFSGSEHLIATDKKAYNVMPTNSTKDYKAIEAKHSQALTTGGNHGSNQGGTYIAWHENKGGILTPSDHAKALRSGASYSYQGVGVRRLTPTECCRLQGFPDNWNENMSDTGRYRQLGNAVTVNVTHWIGRRIVDAVAKNP